MSSYILIAYVAGIIAARLLRLKVLYWLLLLPLSLAVGIIGRLFAPVVCLFVVRAPVLDTVKRLGKQTWMLQRDRLVWWLTWFDTDDNCTDEFWYGWYDQTSNKTQHYYDTHKVYRWYCRVMWLNRNSMYTFNRKFFGIRKDSKLAWQCKADIPLILGYYNSVNIGFKAHRGIDRLMFAGRIIGIRKY